MIPETEELLVVRTIEVDAPVEVAWRTWVEGIGRWWPTDTHSVGGADVRDVRIDPAVGGRVHEVLADGTEHDWGRVVAVEPPPRLVHTWHPGSDPATATEVELTFTALGPDRTRLELRHRGWERRPDAADAARSYDEGWAGVLEDWAAAVPGR
jgi:uncharacterized protein YndB with AHSA1/START domain